MRIAGRMTAALGALVLGMAALPAQALIVTQGQISLMNFEVGHSGSSTLAQFDGIGVTFTDIGNSFASAGLTPSIDVSSLTLLWDDTTPYATNGFSFTVSHAGPESYTDFDFDIEVLFTVWDDLDNTDPLDDVPLDDGQPNGHLNFDLTSVGFLGGSFDAGEAFTALFTLCDATDPSCTTGVLIEDEDIGHGIRISASLAAVPLPAAGWLMLSGLGLLGVMGRRRAAVRPAAA